MVDQSQLDGILASNFGEPIYIGKPPKLVGFSSCDLAPMVHDDGIVGVWIARVYTPPKYRQMGYSRKAMEKLIGVADRAGVDLWIGPSAYGEMNNDQLVAWWMRMGFVSAKDSRDNKLLVKRATS